MLWVVETGSRVYVAPGDTSSSLIDLFLPRYIDAFYPWGPVLQTLYALAVVGHCTFRAYVTAHVLRATQPPAPLA